MNSTISAKFKSVAAILFASAFAATMITVPAFGSQSSEIDGTIRGKELPTQSIAVSSIAPKKVIERDSYTVVSAFEARRLGELQTASSLNSFLTATMGSSAIHDKNDGTVIYPVTSWYFQYEEHAYQSSSRPSHNGVDMAISSGTPIYAIADGTVIEVGRDPGASYGNFVVLQSEINGYTVQTLYAHMVASPPVNVGQSVLKASVIGNVGSTGDSTGSHLHFEVTVNGNRQDPGAWLPLNAIR